MIDIQEELTKMMAEQIQKEIDQTMLEDLLDYVDEEGMDEANAIVEGELKELHDSKVNIDPEYLHTIKTKVEKLLSVLIDHYQLSDCISEKLRYRLDGEATYHSKFHKLFEQQKDIDGKQLRYGYEYVPVDLVDWFQTYMPDYMEVSMIYSLMCDSRRITKKDLITLNKIARKYRVGGDE